MRVPSLKIIGGYVLMNTRPAAYSLSNTLPLAILLVLIFCQGLEALDVTAPETTLDERRDWWSLAPVEKPQVPTVTNDAWSDHPIDRFILSGLEAEGLAPAEPADFRTLIRRLSLTLTGLPPTPTQVEQFCQQADQDLAGAYEQLITRLLDSTHFGERWARHWMDVVRFSETYGFEWNFEIRDAWRYRDYLIRAFNTDLPYDQLVREHLAGDLLSEPRINGQLGINESVIGTAFYRFSETGHDDCVQFPAIRFDALDNQIDTLSKAFQASTISCARCHDHKFDAISTVDYYALVGILESSRPVIHTLDSADLFCEPAELLHEMKVEIRSVISAAWLADLERSEQQLLAALAPQEVEQERTDEEGSAEKLSKGEGNQPALRQQIDQKDLSRENPTFVLQQLARLPAAERQNIRSTWQRLADEYQRQQLKIEQFHADNFEPWGDFRQGDNPAWQVSGLGLMDNGPSPAGEFTIAAGGDEIVSAVLPAGRFTHLISDKLNGSMRSPRLPKHHQYVSLRFLAGGLSMVRAVVDSCVLGEYAGGAPQYFAEATEQWKRFSTGGDSPHHYFLELVTKSDNPRWPERDGMEKGMDVALRQSPRSWFGIVHAVLHDCSDSPKEKLDHIVRLFLDSNPQTELDVAKAYESAVRQAIEAFRDGQATDDDVRWINWALAARLLGNSAAEDTRLAQLVRDYQELEATIAPPRVVVGMADQGPGFDFPVLQGGDFAAPGPPAPRGYLRVLAGPQEKGFVDTTGSGRLELADLIASPGNPLTARVMVNRIWQHLFGTGIVKTPDDFGRMGELPSHPELLDFLASEFVEQRWSVKQLIRQIVTSRTFQQASGRDPASNKQDAGNRLLHHYPVFRLDAEAIRDSILAVSGRLERSPFGPSIQPHRIAEKLHRKLSSGPLDGNGRRSIYIKITRMEGARFLELFDLPDPMATRGRRDRTNVPAQALALLNDPFLIDQAQYWAGELVERSDTSFEERLEAMYLKALGRPPNAPELDRMRAMMERLAELHQVQPDSVLRSEPVWKDVCHAMFNVKELIYVW